MKSLLVPVLLVAIIAWAGCDSKGGSETASKTDGSPGDEQAATTNGLRIEGAWNGYINNVSVTGQCPATPAQSGQVEISEDGGIHTLTLGEGFRCDPAAACVMTGTREKSVLTVSVSEVADDEGGLYSSDMTLNFDASGKSAGGTATSMYEHPEGFECVWTDNVGLSRA